MRCLEALKQSYEQKLAQKDAMIKRFQDLLSKERELSARLLKENTYLTLK